MSTSLNSLLNDSSEERKYMPYTLFDEKFPQIARKETRSFMNINDPVLGDDEFGLLEMYCDEPGCDCRRVMFTVVSRQHEKAIAVIAYGWESAQFYADWFGQHDPDIIREMQGPILNLGSPQSSLAPALLATVEQLLQDKQYVDRPKRHYAMFRDAIDKETAEPSLRRRRRPKKPKSRKRC